MHGVTDWLEKLGLSEYAQRFADNAIDLSVLPDLTDQDLEKIGVLLGHRRKILKAIATLNSGPAAQRDAARAIKPSAGQPAPVPPIDAAEAIGERRYLTVMFCDLVGSTAISAQLDAEEWRDLVGAYLEAASAAVAEMGGHVAKKLGDGLMCLFGYPVAHENDAERAARAALSIQRALPELNSKNASTGKPELAARIGLESGPAVLDAAGEIYGDVANIAARVQALAEPGAVLVTAQVQRQVAGLFVAEERGTHALKGVPEPVALFRLVRASGGGRRSGQRNLTPLVGRDEEIAVLMRRWERARQGEGQLVLIVGEPGLGKSRLIQEFHSRLAEIPHTWVEWTCSQLLQNTPLHPISEWGRQRFGSADTPMERRLADLENSLAQVKLDPAETVPLLAPLLDMTLPKERMLALTGEELRRRQLAALTNWVMVGAKVQPVVLAFEDLHWADPTTLDVLRGIAERGALAPLYIVATTRPEFRPPWGMRSHHGTISLAPLDRGQVRNMVAELSARHALSRDVVDDVAARTGGVPLFVEEVTRLLLERGEQGGAQAIPPTLQQSLMARLDRLGPAREVAQIGSVIGRGFSYKLLKAVAGMDDAPLEAALEKLSDADVVLVEGVLPESNYRFKHALIQDAAYENLLKSRRQILHRRIAETLRDFFADRAAAEPEVLGHHFTQAGMTDAAIEWWGKAGDQALRRSAFQEAISHLGKAIEMADKAAEGTPRAVAGQTMTSQRLRLQTTYGSALLHGRGMQAPETHKAFSRAQELAAGSDDPSARFSIQYALWAGHFVRGELAPLREIAGRALHEVEGLPESPETAVALRLNAATEWFAGNFTAARAFLERARAVFDPQRHSDHAFRFAQDIGVSIAAYLALVLWVLGEIDQARAVAEEGAGRAIRTGHVSTIGYAHFHFTVFEMLRRSIPASAPHIEALVNVSRTHEMQMWTAYAKFFATWLRCGGDRTDAVLAEMRDSIATLRGQSVGNYVPFLTAALAEVEAQAGQVEQALATIDGVIGDSERSGQRWFDAEMHRIRGEILLKRDPKNMVPAEEAFLTAIAIAQQQKARSFELRAALSLAKLYQPIGRAADANAVLAPALEGFSSTPEFLEIEEAQTLLAALAATDEVKNAAAARERRLKLQTTLGQAMMHAHGFGSPETMAVFARARELTSGIEDPSARLAACYGQWVGAYMRGNAALMRATGSSALAEAEGSSDPALTCIAHRIQGITCRVADGDVGVAQAYFERAAALYDPLRDADSAFRFGQDIGVAAKAYLAMNQWLLGQPDRARLLIEEMLTLAETKRHAPTLIYAHWHAAMFESLRLDAGRVKTHTEACLALAAQHDVKQWQIMVPVLLNWAMSRVAGPAANLGEFRRAIAACRAHGLRTVSTSNLWLLAQAEAEAGEIETALVTIATALADLDGVHFWDAEIHRAHGEILLKRDPADTAAAEESFRTAIAVAQQQKTRSFELRAALSLAKLYQSTGRPADAHAVLAPALEGFSPTPEFPEIAAAQALLAVLAESDDMKTEMARRHRRFRLQTAYSNALLHGRGMSPPETTAAFATARELAASIADPAERFSAYYGLWVGPFIRGNLAQMQEVAEAFMRDAEHYPGLPEGGVAHRLLGTTFWYAGDYERAQLHLEQALAVYDHERDAALSSSFGYDQGVPTNFYLGMTAHAFGDVKHAAHLLDVSLRLALQGGHVPTIALARHYMIVFAAVRGELDQAAPHAQALLDLGATHGLPNWVGFAKFALAWRESSHSKQSIADMRAALELQREKDFQVEQPLFATRLAEAEAAAGQLSTALATVDEQRVVIQKTGERWFEAELHRVRGEILLKSAPADTAAAEQALRTAIRIAEHQKARGYKLRAALSLARLYQSTGRGADTRAVLASALEGFSPRPEFPEFAQAQALLAALPLQAND